LTPAVFLAARSFGAFRLRLALILNALRMAASRGFLVNRDAW
jgi:hypothetical protein